VTFALPLATRRRIAETRKRRYHSDPAYRLERINGARAYRGAPQIASLDEMGDPKAGRRNAARDRSGRFA